MVPYNSLQDFISLGEDHKRVHIFQVSITRGYISFKIGLEMVPYLSRYDFKRLYIFKDTITNSSISFMIGFQDVTFLTYLSERITRGFISFRMVLKEVTFISRQYYKLFHISQESISRVYMFFKNPTRGKERDQRKNYKSLDICLNWVYPTYLPLFLAIELKLS